MVKVMEADETPLAWRATDPSVFETLCKLGPTQAVTDGAAYEDRYEAYGRALLVVHLARAENKSLTTAAREAGTRLKTVLRYARPAFGKIKGRWAVKPEDRLPRPLRFYDERGEIVITVRTSHDASLV